jgi:hypothetical protein
MDLEVCGFRSRDELNFVFLFKYMHLVSPGLI